MRTVTYENGQMVMTVGSGSRVDDSIFITRNTDIHVLIGSYSSISYGVRFVFDIWEEGGHTSSHSFAVLEDGKKLEIIIGSDVCIEAGATITGGIRIGDGAIVRAGSVIMEDVPPYSIVVGNPAQIVGYRFDAETIAALQRIAWWNWPEEKIRAHIDMLRGDVKGFLAGVEAEENVQVSDMPQLVTEETAQRLKEFYAAAARHREMIGQNLRSGNREQLLQNITYLATYLYNYNQNYTDDILEGYLNTLVKDLPEISTSPIENKRKQIVFYDGLGDDTRGLALIYLRALSRMDVDLHYITVALERERIPTIEALLNECGGTIYFLPSEKHIGTWARTQLLCSIMNDIHPDTGFLYTMPWDVAGVLAFMRFEGRMKRYQINLTDHAFWLGIHAFDYCLEFRDFGANVSRQYRHVPLQKVLKQPYYPFIDETLFFQGFPFEKNEGDFIVFSGGSIYKTLDREKNYYRIVEFLLSSFPQVKFWYAGTGQRDQVSDLWGLEQKYEGRVFVSGERADLFQILRHVDMYLNTCPHIGGLMTQYSVLAGRAPFTFLCLPKEAGAYSVLLSQEEFGIEYSDMQKFLAELHRFVEDPVYRQEKEAQFCGKKLVITEKEFADNLQMILQEGRSAYPIRRFAVDMRVQEALYAELWGMIGMVKETADTE